MDTRETCSVAFVPVVEVMMISTIISRATLAAANECRPVGLTAEPVLVEVVSGSEDDDYNLGPLTISETK